MFQTYEVRRTDWSNYVNSGVWEEYRYDALGRRVMVRTRTDGGLCDVDPWTCTASVTRFVWAGDNLLWELKQADGSMAAAAGGSVSYFHAGGIDRPLVITKNGQSIIPHQNWRGQFARGTYPNAYKSDCTSYPASGCTPIQWPGERHQRASRAGEGWQHPELVRRLGGWHARRQWPDVHAQPLL